MNFADFETSNDQNHDYYKDIFPKQIPVNNFSILYIPDYEIWKGNGGKEWTQKVDALWCNLWSNSISVIYPMVILHKTMSYDFWLSAPLGYEKQSYSQ